MELTNSYIFLLRDKNKLKKDNKGNYVLDASINVLSILKSYFDVEVDDISLEQIKDDDAFDELLKRAETKFECGNLNFIFDNKECSAKFRLSGADSTEYLDVIVDADDKIKSIKLMEFINDIIMEKNNDFDIYFITIVSYDSISEYYCNLIYPKLNEFERKFRKLLFIIYTAQFKKLYFEETVSQEVRDIVKENLKRKGGRAKKEEDLLKYSMYSLDFGTMQKLLFDRDWLPYDKKKLEKYLNENKDLTLLSDEELREKMLSIKPTNDWERFFSNKNLDEHFESVVKEIGNLRNHVAHNKLFTKDKYERLLELLEKNNHDIDKAISITETEDFKRINNEKFNESLEQIGKLLSDFATSISKYTNDVMKKYNFSEILNNVIPKLSFSKLVEEIVEESYSNQNNK